LGIDLGTETPDPAAIRRAVEQVLADPAYRENVIRLAGELATYNAEERCASYIAGLL
jgi:UDP:flavonoid glycosyltransferase YjiC (YdhE family)